MEKKKEKNNSIVFKLEFTTTKLLAYIVVLSSIALSMTLKSSELAIVGFTIGSLLSGAKTVSDNILKSKIEKIVDKTE